MREYCSNWVEKQVCHLLSPSGCFGLGECRRLCLGFREHSIWNYIYMIFLCLNGNPNITLTRESHGRWKNWNKYWPSVEHANTIWPRAWRVTDQMLLRKMMTFRHLRYWSGKAVKAGLVLGTWISHAEL